MDFWFISCARYIFIKLLEVSLREASQTVELKEVWISAEGHLMISVLYL